MSGLKQTFAVPIADFGQNATAPDAKIKHWIDVPARPSGVPGLVITAAMTIAGPKDGWWVLTHKKTGRALGSSVFESIATARRAAKAVAFIDWTFDSIEDFFKIPKSKRQLVTRRLRELSA